MGAPVVYVVDSDDAIRTAVARLLAVAGFSPVLCASGAELFAALRPGQPGCVVAALRLPDVNGLALQTTLARRVDALPLIFLTAFGTIPEAVCAIRQGAVDFLTKPLDSRELLASVRRAAQIDASNRAARQRAMELHVRFERLTSRECEVFAHLIGGALNKQVAADLGIAERTVKFHRARIFARLEVDSIPDLVRIATALGIPSASAVRPSSPSRRARHGPRRTRSVAADA